MGILGEYDALSSLSQKAADPHKEPLKEGAPGHGCGHCALGTGALAAALAVREYLIANKKDGTIIYFGCPAEVGAGSKQFMARAGMFDDVDFVYSWHPATKNAVECNHSNASWAQTSILRVLRPTQAQPHTSEEVPWTPLNS